VQTVIPLPENTAVKITVAHYYTPKGRIVEGNGLTPDVVVEPKDKNMSLEGTLDIAKDNQLQAGVDFLKKELAKKYVGARFIEPAGAMNGALTTPNSSTSTNGK